MPSKTVAKTLVKVLEDPRIKAVQDLTRPVDDLAKKMISAWSMDLYTRKPGPAYDEDDVFVGTDLDLACFMIALAERNAVIILPKYRARRQAQKTEGEIIVSKDNRHGRIMGLSANKETFSFSVRVEDMNVITDNGTKVGAPRNFMLVDLDGSWYKGWDSIQFVPSAIENDFLNDHSLWAGASVIFKNFVHPNRWISFYGRPYFVTKALIQRLEKESTHLNAEVKRLLAEGIDFPREAARKEWPQKKPVGEAERKTVTAFEAEIDLPEPEGEFVVLEKTQEALVAAADRRKDLVYSTIQKLRFMARATELAYYKHGLMKDGIEKMPAWIQNAAWERDFKQPKKRKKWNRLILTQPGVGEFGIALRYRIWEKTEKVAADS